ncbi:hypothetical protein pdam_00001822 [Pocillopora damicornis]|uniref:UDP-glucuronosyltransferase n=1 Tax=Pocillopora damicornis TaxID=46731 RepID=A0A3M6TP03_POCDA|nr:hypothetical protein pdam_00001822 [Pocillopora damicornis]
MALLTMLLLSLTVNSAFSARIAAFCTIGKSQYMNLRGILEELASRGHEVTMVIPSTEKVQLSDRVQHKIFKIPYEPGFMENELLKLELEGDKFRLLSKMMEVLSTVCESVLNDTKIMEELRGYDLLVYDVLGVCGALIGDRLGVQRVQMLVTPNNPFDHMIPTPLSYIPMMVLPGFTDKMTFLQRVTNVVAYIGLGLFKDLLFARPMDALKLKYNITTERSYQETVDGVELVLIRADFAIEYAQPLLPGNVMVGPLNVKEGKPLPPDLEEFVNDSGGHGFIIVSFGSNLASILPRTVVDTLATAFGKLKQRVVWRLKGYIPSFLGSNIKIVEWLPQNDLLAHKNIKAFVSHVGHDSLYESAYHGVPLVAFPQFADQHFNAKKAENLGNIMVGPLSVREGKPLPPDLEEFVDNPGGDGFIIVSFGSNLASILPRTVVDMLATAFGKLKQRVVWRLKGYIPSFLGSNIKVVEWLPQNDLLAHKNIKAFVSHVGHNSLYESAYHGVPLAFIGLANIRSLQKLSPMYTTTLVTRCKNVILSVNPGSTIKGM